MYEYVYMYISIYIIYMYTQTICGSWRLLGLKWLQLLGLAPFVSRKRVEGRVSRLAFAMIIDVHQ